MQTIPTSTSRLRFALFSIRQFVALKCTRTETRKNFLLNSKSSHGPQLLNLLLWNYNPEQLSSQLCTHNEWQNIINFNLLFALLLFIFSEGADKFLIWRVRTIYFICFLWVSRRKKNHWRDSRRSLAPQSKSINNRFGIPLIFSVSLSQPFLSPRIHRLPFLFDKWLI